MSNSHDTPPKIDHDDPSADEDRLTVWWDSDAAGIVAFGVAVALICLAIGGCCHLCQSSTP